MHEFLVLHYMATDSAQGWDDFLGQCIPNGNWMPATTRRAMLMNMFDKCHIAPSHRRMAHPSWAASMTLLVDLLCGNGKHRYLRTKAVAKAPVQVTIRGFSAGSWIARNVSRDTCFSRTICCSFTAPVIPYASGNLDPPLWTPWTVSTALSTTARLSSVVALAMLSTHTGTGLTWTSPLESTPYGSCYEVMQRLPAQHSEMRPHSG